MKGINIEEILKYKTEIIHRRFRLNIFAEKLGELNKKNLLHKTNIVNNLLLVIYNTELSLLICYEADYEEAVRIAKRRIREINNDYFNRSACVLNDLYKKTEDAKNGIVFFTREMMYKMLSIKEDENGFLWLYDFNSLIMQADEYFKPDCYSTDTKKKVRNITRNTESEIIKIRKIDCVLYYHFQGLTGKEIMEKTGISEKTIYKYIRDEENKSFKIAGKEDADMNKIDKKERDERILKLYNKGLTQNQVAEKMNCSRSLVVDVLNKHNETQHEKLKERDFKIVKLRNQGLTQEEIAKEIGNISRTTVTRVLKESQEKGLLEMNGWKTREDIIAESKAIAKNYMEEQRQNEENN